MTKKPNIILITIDCLRADHCGWLNHENKELTPFLNSLANESLVFTHAYATGPATYFSFPGILTGTYPLSFKGWDKKNFPGLKQRPNLAEILQRNGYFTVAIHDNPYLSSFFGYDRGFDIFKDLKKGKGDIRPIFDRKKNWKKLDYVFIEQCFCKLNQFKWYFYLKTIFSEKTPKLYNFLKAIIIQTRIHGIPLRINTPAQIINEAILVEMQFSRAPWFLWIHYMDSHYSFFPPKEMLPLDISEEDVKRNNIQYMRSISKQNLRKESFELVKKLYQLQIKYLDNQISQLFNKLKNKIKDSLIVITSDHGEEFGEHGGSGHRPNQANSKLYKELVHVPLVIKLTGQRGKIINKIVSCAQIPATILELIGIEPLSGMEPSLFDNNKIKVYSESVVFSPSLDQFDLNARQEVVFTDNT